MSTSDEDQLETYISQIIDEEDERKKAMNKPTLDMERAALFAILMIASNLDGINGQLVRLVQHVKKSQCPEG